MNRFRLYTSLFIAQCIIVGVSYNMGFRSRDQEVNNVRSGLEDLPPFTSPTLHRIATHKARLREVPGWSDFKKFND